MSLTRREKQAFDELQLAVFGKSGWAEVEAASTGSIELLSIGGGVYATPVMQLDGVDFSQSQNGWLLKDQIDERDNGVWVVNSVNPGVVHLVRSAYYRSAEQLNNSILRSAQGEENAGSQWVITVNNDYVEGEGVVTVQQSSAVTLDGGTF